MIIIVVILIFIVIGEIGLCDLLEVFKFFIGWVVVFCGGLVVVLFFKGVGLIVFDL